MNKFLIGISITLLLFGNAELSADRLYTWTDAKGNLHITEHPPPKSAKTKNVMTYQPRTEAQIQKLEEDERRKQMQDEPEQKKVKRPEAPKASAKSEKQDEAEVYVGREGKMIRRGEEGKEMRDRRQDVRREYRFHRR